MKCFRYTYPRNLQAAGDERAVPYELLVAAPTQKAATEAFGVPSGELKSYGGEVQREGLIAAVEEWPAGTVLARRFTPPGTAPNPLRPLADVLAEHYGRQA